MVFLWNNVGINGINTVKILLIGLDEGMFSLFAQGAAVRQTPERHWSPDTGFSQGAHNCSLTDISNFFSQSLNLGGSFITH